MEVRFPLLMDAATGTELQKHGMPAGVCSEKWTLEHPEVIVNIQKGYVAAGSQVLYTPTFGANRVKLEANHIFNQVEEYNMRLAALSKEAAGDKALVAGDMSPTGQFLYPLGNKTFEEFYDIYHEQAAALEKAGVDLFVIETMMTVAEARAALLAVRDVSDKPAFVSFTCDENGRTLTGCDIAAVLQIMQGMGCDAFGMNCSVGPDQMVPQLKRLKEIARVPLIAKANAGVPELVNGKTVYNCPPEEYASHIEAMAEAGVMIYGGCCGTAAEHIAAIKEKLAQVEIGRPAPADNGLLPAATEKELFFLDPGVGIGKVLECGDDLEDDLEEELESDDVVVAIAIRSEDELDNFADCQYMISKPLCLVCDDAVLLEQALRLYQGRALYEGTLSEEKLQPLQKKYGLIY